MVQGLQQAVQLRRDMGRGSLQGGHTAGAISGPLIQQHRVSFTQLPGQRLPLRHDSPQPHLDHQFDPSVAKHLICQLRRARKTGSDLHISFSLQTRCVNSSVWSFTGRMVAAVRPPERASSIKAVNVWPSMSLISSSEKRHTREAHSVPMPKA